MELNHNKDFDNQVKKKFDDFSPEVPSSVWNRIEKGVNTELPSNLADHKIHSHLIDLDKRGHQINDSTVISDPKVKNIDQEIKGRGIDREIRNIDRSFKYKRFIGIAASFLIIGFSIWKFQPEEKIFLRGSEDLVVVTDPDLAGNSSKSLGTDAGKDDSRVASQNQLIEDVRIAKSSKAKINGTENQKGISFEESTFAETSESLKPAPVKMKSGFGEIASISSSKSITFSESERSSGSVKNKISSSASSHKSRLESSISESLDNNQEQALKNQELALNTPNNDRVSVVNPNVGEPNANVLNTPSMRNDNRLPRAESSASISNEEGDLAETEPKERQKIVSSVLNFLASNIQIGGDKVVEFSETENGIIKVDLKGIFARNNR